MFTKKNALYTRLKILRTLPMYRECAGYEEFKERVNANDIDFGIDNEVDINDDEAHTLARECCEEIMNDCGKSSMFSIIDYLELISRQAKGFSYEKIK